LYMELPKGIETKDGNRKKRMCSSYWRIFMVKSKQVEYGISI
jgi:hypothetical protein